MMKFYSIVIKEFPLTIGDGASIEYEMNKKLFLYPSSVKLGGEINISQPSEQVTVYDIGGTIILENTNTKQVSTLGWKPGIYLVKVQSHTNEVISKISVY